MNTTTSSSSPLVRTADVLRLGQAIQVFNSLDLDAAIHLILPSVGPGNKEYNQALRPLFENYFMGVVDIVVDKLEPAISIDDLAQLYVDAIYTFLYEQPSAKYYEMHRDFNTEITRFKTMRARVTAYLNETVTQENPTLLVRSVTESRSI